MNKLRTVGLTWPVLMFNCAIPQGENGSGAGDLFVGCVREKVGHVWS